MAGGTNLIDLMKDGVEKPTRLIDINRLPLKSIEQLPKFKVTGQAQYSGDFAFPNLAYAVMVQSTIPNGRKQVVSYLGFNPSEESSGGRQRLGSISKQGNSMVRYLLVEAAQTASLYDPELRRDYRRIQGEESWSDAAKESRVRTTLRFPGGAKQSRSLRTEYNICNNCARNNCSRGIDGRPTLAYIWWNSGDNCFRTSSTIVRIGRSG